MQIFGKIKFVKYIRDPIHGLIGLYEHERDVVDLPIFQRLRNIRQLGLASYVYPSANHTRFEHSVGVIHTITDFYNALIKSEISDSEVVDFLEDSMFEHSGQIGNFFKIRMAGLLHDLGHPPFSHGLENVLDHPHEEYTYALLERSSVRDVLFSKGWSNNDINEIKNLLKGEVGPDRRFLSSMIDSAIDADRMDYLLRDSYHCGVKYGIYDYPRLIRGLSVRNYIKDTNRKREETIDIIFNSKALEEVENFLMARYRMFMQIYLHKTYIGFLNALWKVYYWLKENEDNLGLTLYPKPNDIYLEEMLIERDEIWFLSMLKNIYRQLQKPYTHLTFENLSKETALELLKSILYRKRVKLALNMILTKVDKEEIVGKMPLSELEKILAEASNVPVDAIMVDDQSFKIYQTFKPNYIVYLYDKDKDAVFRIDKEKTSVISDIAEKELVYIRIFTLEKYYEKVLTGLRKIELT
ncbi:MAG: HD domain-containing protein [Candidatus Njordarchaeia archaeon]